MPSVSPTTARRLRYASGYLGLAMLHEATEELALISPADAAHPDVLGVRIELHTEKKQWDFVVGYGEQLARQHPEKDAGWIAWAYALRELNRVEEAKAVLLEAEPLHGRNSGVLHYNLACYHCLLGERNDARQRLRKAFRMGQHWKEAALEDGDLTAMREEIATMES